MVSGCMSIEDDPYVKALLAINLKLTTDIAALRGAFVKDALMSGRHTPESIADVLEQGAVGDDDYANSSTAVFVGLLRSGKEPWRSFTVIDGGKKD